MTTSKEKQKHFNTYFYEKLYFDRGYKLLMRDSIITDEFTTIYLCSYDNRGGELRIDPSFSFINNDLRNIAINAGVDHFAFETVGHGRQGTRMASDIGIYDPKNIYVQKFSLDPQPPAVNHQNYIETLGASTTYKIIQEGDIPEAFLHHKYFMEVIGFKYIEMMKTPEGIDKIYNDYFVQKDEAYIKSEKGKWWLSGFYDPPLRVIYSLISAKLISDERYRAVLERHKMMEYEWDLITENMNKIIKYFG